MLNGFLRRVFPGGALLGTPLFACGGIGGGGGAPIGGGGGGAPIEGGGGGAPIGGGGGGAPIRGGGGGGVPRIGGGMGGGVCFEATACI